ncbi:hypothetical protein T02_6685, partial [Trichinella nativa]
LDLLINTVLFIYLVNARILPNPPVDTGPSSPSDSCVNSPVWVTNDPSRESGSLHWWPVREMALRGVATACYGPPQPFPPTWIRLSSWTR